MHIFEEKREKKAHLALLLLGDEQEDMIDRYHPSCRLFCLEEAGAVRAVCAVTEEQTHAEIKNLAVDPAYQRRGLGRSLVEFVAETYQKPLLVGTGESPLTLPFYHACGFAYSHREENFFTDHYDHPIFEAGVQLRDMIYLRREPDAHQTKDLILKKAEFSDWRAIWQNLWRHESAARYMLWSPTLTEEAAMDRMHRTLAHQARNNHAYLVYEKTTGAAIGFAGMMQIAPDAWEDTGVALGPEFQKKGYGSQILACLKALAFAEPGCARFVCSCRAENEASRRTLLKGGLTYTHSEMRTDPRTGAAYTLEFYEVRND